MTIRIRPYRPSDREHILSLVTRFSEFELPEWRRKAEIDQANGAFLEQALNQQEPNSAIFVAEEESETFAGFIHLQTQTDYFNDEKHGYISDIAVAETFEGQGVGRMLLDRAEAWSQAQGYPFLTLYVFAGNDRARQVYEKNGFRQEVIKYVKPLRYIRRPKVF